MRYYEILWHAITGDDIIYVSSGDYGKLFKIILLLKK